MEKISNQTMLDIELDIVRAPDVEHSVDNLFIASQYVFRSMMRPPGAKIAYYQRHFDEAIEDLHNENPQISRALLARMAVREVAVSERFPCAEDTERQLAMEMLQKDFISL